MTIRTESDLLNILAEVVCKVLETSTFGFATPCDKDDVPAQSGALAAVIDFSGEISGQLTIAAPVELCAILAAAILSIEPEDVEPAQLADAMQELANIVCGQWVTTISGTEPVIRLSVPRSQPLGSGQWQDLLERETCVSLDVEDLPFLVELISR